MIFSKVTEWLCSRHHDPLLGYFHQPEQDSTCSAPSVTAPGNPEQFRVADLTIQDISYRRNYTASCVCGWLSPVQTRQRGRTPALSPRWARLPLQILHTVSTVSSDTG